MLLAGPKDQHHATNMAHIRQSRPDPGLSFLTKSLKRFLVFLFTRKVLDVGSEAGGVDDREPFEILVLLPGAVHHQHLATNTPP